MKLQEALSMAEKWTADMAADKDYRHIPLFDAMKTLLDHARQQSKDIEELTLAIRVLFRRNRELEDDLRRSRKAGEGLDSGA